MENSENNLNAILLQYYPIPRDINGNIKKVEKLLEEYKLEDEIDIILLPEMALTGYIFDNKDDIAPYLEEYNKGVTFDFCKSISLKFDCFVFCGYPEKENELFYNSCMIVDRNGNALKSYRKHFLYEMDKTWCVEGPEFGYLEINLRNGKLVKLGIGICMDLNPYEFTAAWEEMEFSTYCCQMQVDIILFLTNWLDNEPNKQSKKEVMHMLNYWVMRLEPFLNKNNFNKKVYFLAANRTGKERDTTFIGCSCAVKIENQKPLLLDNLNKKEENSIFVSCQL